jgi:hypothetical protein
VRSNDIRANIVLGGNGDLGSLRVRSADGTTVVQLRASDANVTNAFLNDENRSNGLVKAWARMNRDGTIAACWRCNRDPIETRRIGTGLYEVDFTPLSTDIGGRPRSAAANNQFGFAITADDTSGDPSSVVAASLSQAGAPADRDFFVLIY